MALAVAVPTLTLLLSYAIAGSPTPVPAPATLAVHGVKALLVYVYGPPHDALITLGALLIVNVCVTGSAARWFASPACVMVTLAVPAFVLLVYTKLGAPVTPPAPLMVALHGVNAVPV